MNHTGSFPKTEHSGENLLKPFLKIIQPIQKRFFCHVDRIFHLLCVFQKITAYIQGVLIRHRFLKIHRCPY